MLIMKLCVVVFVRVSRQADPQLKDLTKAKYKRKTKNEQKKSFTHTQILKKKRGKKKQEN